jgi:hypothetical protein
MSLTPIFPDQAPNAIGIQTPAADHTENLSGEVVFVWLVAAGSLWLMCEVVVRLSN